VSFHGKDSVAHRLFTVAVVDDDESILRSLEHLLESADYGVRLFKSAAALLRSDFLVEIDCLISNIDMPDMGDFELLVRIHAARPALPTILVTDDPGRLDQLPPSLGGIYPGLFTKPFEARELLAAVGDIRRNSLG